jgi:hypothetical protein
MSDVSSLLKITGKVGETNFEYQGSAEELNKFLGKESELPLDQDELADKQALRDFPSILFIYDLAVTSYETSIKRMDAINARLESLMVFTITANGIIIGATVKNTVYYQRWEFYAAMAVLLIILIVGTVARLYGKILALYPKEFLDESNLPPGGAPWFHLREFKFKYSFIAHAGNNFEASFRVIKYKWKASICLSLLFAVEIVLICVWLSR